MQAVLTLGDHPPTAFTHNRVLLEIARLALRARPFDGDPLDNEKLL